MYLIRIIYNNFNRDYLVSEHLDKKKASYDVSAWDLVHAKDIPRQLNGSDCGVFACKYAEYITRDVPVTFTQVRNTIWYCYFVLIL